MKLTLILSFGLLISCKKESLSSFDINYQGEWHSDSVQTALGTWVEDYIIISGDEGEFGEMCELFPMGTNCNIFSGPAEINSRKTKFYIGGKKFQDIRIIFRIDESPHVNSDGKWECTLTGQRYIRK